MDSVANTLTSSGFDAGLFIQAALVLLVSSVVLGFLGRFAFGKKSVLNRSVSASIGILFIYAATVVIYSTGAPLEQFVSPLPFVHISGESMMIFSFEGAAFPTICSELLSMIILAFLVNLLDNWIPEGKNLITWIFFRCVTIVGAMLLHVLVNYLLAMFLPEGLLTYAPTVLLCVLVVMLLTGALKLLVGAAIATVNPIIGALYTFFFATMIGKQLSKAVLSTAILAALVFALNKLGVTVISIASAALMAYIPFLLLLLAVWYLVRKVL